MTNGNSGLFKGTIGDRAERGLGRPPLPGRSIYECKLKEQMALLEAIQQEEKEHRCNGVVVDLSHEILLIARELESYGLYDFDD